MSQCDFWSQLFLRVLTDQFAYLYLTDTPVLSLITICELESRSSCRMSCSIVEIVSMSLFGCWITSEVLIVDVCFLLVSEITCVSGGLLHFVELLNEWFNHYEQVQPNRIFLIIICDLLELFVSRFTTRTKFIAQKI